MSQYKAYPVYKDSGVEWIGQVPEGWEVKPFFALVTELNRKNVGLIETNILSLSYGNIIQKPETRNMGLTPESYETYQIVESGEIIFRFTDLQNDKRSLRSAQVTQRGIITSAYMAVKPHSIDSTYFAWMMRSYDLCKVFYAMGGGLRQSLKFEDIKRLPVLIPPTEEQCKITNAINAGTTRIDALIHKKTRFIKLLKEKRQALITHAVTKGLDPNVRMKDSGVEWIGQVPEHWKIAQIKRISALNPKKSTLSEEKDSLCTFLPMEKLRTNALTLDETRPIHEVYGGYSYFCDDDILIAKVTPCFENGNIAVANGLVNGIGFGSTEINVLRVNGKGHNRFLYYRLQEEQFRTIAKSEMRGTGGLKRVPTDLFESFTIGLPDTDEQATIAATLDRETARIDALISKAEQSITLLKERRAAFITAAVTGQIDLRGE